MLAHPVLTPKSSPAHLNGNRIRNLCRAVEFYLRKKTNLDGLGDSGLPFDRSEDGALNFVAQLSKCIKKNCRLNYRDTQLQPIVAESLCYMSWQHMTFVIKHYREFLLGKYEFNGVRLIKPTVTVSKSGEPEGIVLPGWTSSRRDGISAGILYRISKTDNVYYLKSKDDLYSGTMGRCWGGSINDVIAWVCARELWDYGPMAWNIYLTLSAYDKITSSSQFKAMQEAEDEMELWYTNREL